MPLLFCTNHDAREYILATPGVVAYHEFRVRRVGDVFEVDFHLQVDSNLAVERGHAIASDVKSLLIQKHPEISKVLAHVEPAPDEHLSERGIFGSGCRDVKSEVKSE